ncbi:hypothetical protein Holit_02823 [Hollandina sp. SP2]
MEWRIETLERLLAELEAWQLDRNIRQQIVLWQFTAEGARIKNLYIILCKRYIIGETYLPDK